MQTIELRAQILLESRTFQLVLEQILESYQIDSKRSEDASSLLASLTDQDAPDLIFIGKESAIKAGMTAAEFIQHLRAKFSGPILLLSTEQETPNIESYVSSGVTDVFSPSEFEQVERFISNYLTYQNTVADVSHSKVLLVEDSRSVTKMITELFRQNNIEVLCVPTGKEALALLHFESVDLVITDYMLEGDMTGLALIRDIRRYTQWYSLPILAITGYNDPERNKELLRSGVSDIMHKPFDIELFLIKCQNLIQNKRTFQMLMNKEQTLTDMSQKDTLTGLYNRAYLKAFSERFIEKNINNDKALYLIHLDCDDFKDVNTQIGHDEADLVLKELGELLAQQLEKDTVLARLDGDEFMISLPNYSFDKALQVADQLRERVAQYKFCGGSVSFTVSVGVSGEMSSCSFSDIYVDTDKAITNAKNNGKNQVGLGDFMKSVMSD